MKNAPTLLTSFYSPQLDGLRFIAALLVFIHHSPNLSSSFLGQVNEYGWIGVDLFLCISAFLLTRLLRLEFQRKEKIQIGKFFIRRALRIWPLYLSYATFVCVLAVFWYDQNATETVGWWLSHVTFTNNLMTALKGYSTVPFSSHLWTISLEEQAYLIMPFLLLAFMLSGSVPSHLKYFSLASLAVLIGARLGFFLNDAPHPFIWVLPLRADAFIIGAVAAIITEESRITRPITCMAIGILLMSSVVYFPNINEHSLYQVFGYTVVACGCVLVVVASQAQMFHDSILASRPLRYLGKISYGIYVYHVICIAAVSKAMAYFGLSNHFGVLLAGLLVTIMVSSISYYLLERPFLKLKERFQAVHSRPI